MKYLKNVKNLGQNFLQKKKLFVQNPLKCSKNWQKK